MATSKTRSWLPSPAKVIGDQGARPGRQLGLPTAAQTKLKEAIRELAAQGQHRDQQGQLIRKARR